MTVDVETFLERWPGYERQSWSERFAELDRQHSQTLAQYTKTIEQLQRQITDRAYMLEAIVQMLGPKGREVWKLWQDKGVQRIHSSWADDPYAQDGEAIAQRHLSIEEAIKGAEPVDFAALDRAAIQEEGET